MPQTHWFDYQLENFDPPPDEELMCSICRCVFFDPVECPCRHVFCKKCITQWLTNHKSCPACRKRISKATLQDVIPIIKNMIMKLTLLCRNSEKGCKAKCTVELYESHLKSCGYELIHCGNGTCDAVFMRIHKEQHEDMECRYRSASCEMCKLSVVYCARESHDCIRELQMAIQEKDAKIAELQQETDVLKQEIEKYKMEREKRKHSIDTSSSESGDISSASSISLSPSSSNDDSDLEDYSVRIFSLVHATESFSMPPGVANESENVDPIIENISRPEDFLPMDSTNNYTDNSPKSSSSDYQDSDQFSPVQSYNLSGTAEQSFNSSGIRIAENFPLSPRRSLKRRMQDSESTASLNQSTRSSPPRTPFFDRFCGAGRSRMAHSDTEFLQNLSESAEASGGWNFRRYQNEAKQSVGAPNETIEILDSSSEDGRSSNANPDVPSSSYGLPDIGQSSNSYFIGSASGSNCYRSRLLKQKGFKRLRGKTNHIDDRNDTAPRSRIPLPVVLPGSSSTPLFTNNRMSYCPVHNCSSPERSDGRNTNHPKFGPGLKKTLSLLSKYASKESDPDWVPSNDCNEESDTDSATTSSSKEKSPGLGEDLSYFPPTFEQERECDSTDTSSSNSESWATDISETDSSYEVEVPPTAWDLIQRYCDEDSEDDSEWFPALASYPQ